MFNQYRDMKKLTRPNIVPTDMNKKTTSELNADDLVYKRPYQQHMSEHVYENERDRVRSDSSPQIDRNQASKKLERTKPMAMPRLKHIMHLGSQQKIHEQQNVTQLSRTPDSVDNEDGAVAAGSAFVNETHTHNSQTDDSSDELNEESIIQQRLKIFIKSIINSESIYLNKLKNLMSFRKFLENNCTLTDLTQYDVQILFSNVEQLYTIHERFFDKLIQINRKVSSVANKDNREFILLIDCFDSFECMLHECLKNYLSFLNSYTKAMTILNKFEKQKNDFRIQNHARILAATNKRKSFIECEHEFSVLINDDNNDMSKIYSEDLLRRPLKLVEYLMSLKEECHNFIRHKNYRIVQYELNELNNRMRSLFENMELKQLKEEILSKIDKNVLPTKVRINNDVVELCEPSNERKLRHLILFGDCLVCCKVKRLGFLIIFRLKFCSTIDFFGLAETSGSSNGSQHWTSYAYTWAMKKVNNFYSNQNKRFFFQICSFFPPKKLTI
jgi:hypothetical protein